MFWQNSNLWAQTVVSSGTFSEVTAASATLVDPVINCDMVSDPNTTTIKVIAWGDGEVISGSSASTAGIYVEDGSGNNSTISLPSGAKQPDVALANYVPIPFGNTLYQVVVTYVIGGNLYFAVYNLQNVGVSTFYIPSTPSYSRNLSSSCNGYPHIDFWVGNSYTLYGAGAMQEFVVVWSEGSSETLEYYSANAASPSGGSVTPLIDPITSSPITGCRMPDVACYTDVLSTSSTYGDLFF